MRIMSLYILLFVITLHASLHTGEPDTIDTFITSGAKKLLLLKSPEENIKEALLLPENTLRAVLNKINSLRGIIQELNTLVETAETQKAIKTRAEELLKQYQPTYNQLLSYYQSLQQLNKIALLDIWKNTEYITQVAKQQKLASSLNSLRTSASSSTQLTEKQKNNIFDKIDKRLEIIGTCGLQPAQCFVDTLYNDDEIDLDTMESHIKNALEKKVAAYNNMSQHLLQKYMNELDTIKKTFNIIKTQVQNINTAQKGQALLAQLNDKKFNQIRNKDFFINIYTKIEGEIRSLSKKKAKMYLEQETAKKTGIIIETQIKKGWNQSVKLALMLQIIEQQKTLTHAQKQSFKKIINDRIAILKNTTEQLTEKINEYAKAQLADVDINLPIMIENLQQQITALNKSKDIDESRRATISTILYDAIENTKKIQEEYIALDKEAASIKTIEDINALNMAIKKIYKNSQKNIFNAIKNKKFFTELISQIDTEAKKIAVATLEHHLNILSVIAHQKP